MYYLRSDDIPGAQPKRHHRFLTELKSLPSQKSNPTPAPEVSKRLNTKPDSMSVKFDNSKNGDYRDSLTRLEHTKPLHSSTINPPLLQKSNSMNIKNQKLSRNLPAPGFKYARNALDPKISLLGNPSHPKINIKPNKILNPASKKETISKRYQHFRNKFQPKLQNLPSNLKNLKISKMPKNSKMSKIPLSRSRGSLARAIENDNLTTLENKHYKSTQTISKPPSEIPSKVYYPDYQNMKQYQSKLRLNNMFS